SDPLPRGHGSLLCDTEYREGGESPCGTQGSTRTSAPQAQTVESEVASFGHREQAHRRRGGLHRSLETPRPVGVAKYRPTSEERADCIPVPLPVVAAATT